MKDKSFGNIFNGMWANLEAMNGKSLQFYSKKFPALNEGKPILFTIEGIFSGDTTKYNFADLEDSRQTGGTVKMLKTTMDNTVSEDIMQNGSPMKFPMTNIKTFIENIVIDGISYKIDNEKTGGFGNVIVLEVVRR